MLKINMLSVIMLSVEVPQLQSLSFMIEARWRLGAWGRFVEQILMLSWSL